MFKKYTHCERTGVQRLTPRPPVFDRVALAQSQGLTMVTSNENIRRHRA